VDDVTDDSQTSTTAATDETATTTLPIDERFLLFPIDDGSALSRVRLIADGRVVREFTARLGQPAQWWAHLDVSAWRGREVTLIVEPYPGAGADIDETARRTASTDLLAAVRPSSEIWSPETLYRERLRPQLHFSSRRGWLNDPHVVYSDGEYHLYYQHNPYACSWGNGHWGHAVSTDLVHWRELPIALYPEEGCILQSGSIVVDEGNTSGFHTGDEKALVALYTTRGRMVIAGTTGHVENDIPPTQHVAFSNDRGRTWTKYDENPVIPHIIGGNRDPSVFWYEPGQKWVMALYMDESDFSLFSSTDLVSWEKTSDVTIPGEAECPELYEFAIDGDPANTRWVLYGALGRYLIGDFDGDTFTPASGPYEIQHGNCWYASQIFRGIPAADGRCIVIAWGHGPELYPDALYRDMPFNQAMALPIELTLRVTPDGPRLFVDPVAELTSLRAASHAGEPGVLRDGHAHPAGVMGELLDLETEVRVGTASEVRVEVRGVPVVYDVATGELSCAGKSAPLEMEEDGRIRLRILVDRTTIDIFANGGRLYMPIGLAIDPDERSVSVTAHGGDAHLDALEVFELTSSWE
jgi:sucrose-6-phosphate hydrolase SacC (GH32 family)